MPEIVWNPLTGKPVACAPERSRRPGARVVPAASHGRPEAGEPSAGTGSPSASGSTKGSTEDGVRSSTSTPTGQPEREQNHEQAGEGASRSETVPACPLCEGNEQLTPPEVYAAAPDASRRPDTPGWVVRVVPNLFPIVEGPGRRHEVVVHSPFHKTSLTELDPAEIQATCEAWRARLEAAASEQHCRFFMVGINEGRDAGASIAHSHSQVFWLDLLPPVAASEMRSLARRSKCPICRQVQQSRSPHSILEGDDGLFAFVPPWSETAHEVLMGPTEHSRNFSSESHILGRILRIVPDLAAALASGAAGPGPVSRRETSGPVPSQGAAHAGEVTGRAMAPFNVVVHTGLPRQSSSSHGFHWHAHFYPRLQVSASIELGTGMGVCPLDPAEAAARYRESLR